MLSTRLFVQRLFLHDISFLPEFIFFAEMDESNTGLFQQVDQLDHVDPGLILQLYHSQEGLKNEKETSLEQVSES
jgi:hypothetical protein